MLAVMSHYRLMFSRFGQYSAAFAVGGGGSLFLNSALIQQNQSQQPLSTTPACPASWRTTEYAPAMISAAHQPNQKTEETSVKLARKIYSEVDRTGLGIRLYQYQTCPYCCKVRAFLDFFGFSYEVVEVNPVTRSQIKFSKDYKKVPIMKTVYEKPLVESSLIISMLATFLVRPEIDFPEIPAMYPEQRETDKKTGKEVTKHMNEYYVIWGETSLTNDQIQKAREEREWREWVDSHFIHLISPNVYRSWAESLETFRWFDQVGDWHHNFPTWERLLAVYVGAAAMLAISKRLKKRHHITDEREAMREAFQKFLDAKGPHRRFIGGEQPNLADLAMYGACNSFVGCTAFIEMRQQNPKLGEWFDAVDNAVKEGRGKHVLEAKSRAIQQQQK